MSMEEWTRKNVVISNIESNLVDLYEDEDRLKERLHRIEIQIEKHETVLEHLKNDTEDIDDE